MADAATDERLPYLSLRGDVANEVAVERLISTTVDRFGRVDILVNNAGIMKQARFEDIAVSDWDQLLSVNLRSVFLCTQAVVGAMKARRYGRIINVASQLGQIGGTMMAHYCASKAGMIGLTKALARELGRDNILVNAIAPALIDTAMTSALERHWRDAKLSTLPLQRMGTVEEVADTAVFLASDAASYFTGQTLGPNGGDVML